MIVSGYGRLIHETFESVPMRAAMGWLAAQSGPAPTEPGTGPFAAWYAAVHESGAKRAKGGSGMLTVALRRGVGGDGRDGDDGRAAWSGFWWRAGRAVGVAAGGTAYRGRAVVAACHVLTTFQDLLTSRRCRRTWPRLRSVNVGNGFGMTVRCAASELPDYGGGWPTKFTRGCSSCAPPRSS